MLLNRFPPERDLCFNRLCTKVGVEHPVRNGETADVEADAEVIGEGLGVAHPEPKDILEAGRELAPNPTAAPDEQAAAVGEAAGT